MVRGGSVYILSNKNNTVLYTGVSSDIISRIIEHREKIDARSFTTRYNVHKLVYYEDFHSIEEAIEREKQIKARSRSYKIKLIESKNPLWKDLFDELED